MNFPGFPKKMEIRHYLFILVLLLATFVRFWNIPNSVQFLGDQGRDALIVSKIFKNHDLVFIGPVTSVGNMYLGPLYYYFMVPFLMLSYPSPLGPVYAVAFLGLLTIYLMYVLGKEMVGERAALFAATLMAFSAIVVSFTRFSWNPNPAPLISLLMIYAIFKAIKSDVKYWAIVILLFSVLIQLHYLTLLSSAGIGLIWLWQLISRFNDKKLVKKMFFATAVGAVIFFTSILPLVLFDLKHDALNFKAFQNILVGEDSFEQTSTDLKGRLSEYVRDTQKEARHILVDIPLGQNNQINLVFLAIILILLFLNFRELKVDQRKKYKYGINIIFTFLFSGIFLIGFYQHTIYDHYVAYLFPITFLTLGITGDYLYKKGILGKFLILVFIFFFLKYNLPLMKIVMSDTGGRIVDIQRAVDTITSRVKQNEKYNIILLTGTGDIEGQNYRYFLSATNNPPVVDEDRGNIDTLFIINDDRVLTNVVDSPIYEIVVFPNKIPSEVYEVENGPEITVLRRE